MRRGNDATEAFRRNTQRLPSPTDPSSIVVGSPAIDEPRLDAGHSLRRPTAFSSRDTASLGHYLVRKEDRGFSENSRKHARIFTSRMLNGTWPTLAETWKQIDRASPGFYSSLEERSSRDRVAACMYACMYVISSPSPVLLAFLLFPVFLIRLLFPISSLKSQEQ